MNKITKIGVLGLALAACLVVIKANADTTGVKRDVTLKLTPGSNTCTMQNYGFGEVPAAIDDVVLTGISGGLTCTFLENAASTVTLSLTDLSGGGVDGTYVIPNTAFNMAISGATASGAIGNLAAKTADFPAQGVVDIYSKAKDALGAWSTTLTIGGRIPKGTAGGQYKGVLELSIQAAQ